MMMLCPLYPSFPLYCFPHTHTDVHTLLMGFHNKWIFLSTDAGHKSMLPGLLLIHFANAHLDKITDSHTDLFT